jgi:hypothetical protein
LVKSLTRDFGIETPTVNVEQNHAHFQRLFSNVMETNNYAQNNSWKCGILKQININLIVFNNCYVYVIYLMCYCIKINNIFADKDKDKIASSVQIGCQKYTRPKKKRNM